MSSTDLSNNGVIGPITVTDDAATTGQIYIETNGHAVVALELHNLGPVALAGLSVYRAAGYGTWHVLANAAANYQIADPQELPLAIDPEQVGYVELDPTTLAALDHVRIMIPADGHSRVKLVPLTAADTTIITGTYSVGE